MEIMKLKNHQRCIGTKIQVEGIRVTARVLISEFISISTSKRCTRGLQPLTFSGWSKEMTIITLLTIQSLLKFESNLSTNLEIYSPAQVIT